MSKADTTRATLLSNARALFWARGFSNVSVREIATAAGVDVALISRYFGSKQGLFEATLVDLPAIDAAQVPDVATLVEMVVTLFSTTPRGGPMPSPTTLILVNANDPDVGGTVRDIYREGWHEPITAILGDAGKAARFSAAMLGMSIAEKTLHLGGIGDPRSDAYRDELRRYLLAALEV